MSLDYRCEVCRAKPGQPCTNTIDPDQPLPGRGEHHARALEPDDTRRRRLAREAS